MGAMVRPETRLDSLAESMSQVPYLEGGKPIAWDDQPEKNHAWFRRMAAAVMPAIVPAVGEV